MSGGYNNNGTAAVGMDRAGTPSPASALTGGAARQIHSVAYNTPNLPANTKLERLHTFMDKQCKWIVSSIVFGVCLANTYVDARTVVVPYFVLSALGAAMAGKGLKKIIKQSRPNGAQKSDHGMPSSHAVSLGFLSTAVCVAGYAQLYINVSTAASSDTTADILAPTADGAYKGALLLAQCGVALASGLYFSLLRIRQGHHTLEQVLVGYAFGFGCCVVAAMMNYSGWQAEGAITAANNRSLIGGRVDDERYVSAAQRGYLNVVFVVGAVGFAVRYCRRWLNEKGTSLAKKPAPNEMFSPTTANPSFLGIQPTAEERDARR